MDIQTPTGPIILHPTMSDIITEGNVGCEILSHCDQDYLYTGMVCKSWYKLSTSKYTDMDSILLSSSRVKEAVDSGMNMGEIFFHFLEGEYDISIMETFHEMGYKWEQDDVEHAAETGMIEAVEFMKNEGYMPDERVLHTAVRSGQIDTVEYLLSTGCPMDTTVIKWGFGPNIIEELKLRSLEMAILHGNIEMVKMLRSFGFPSSDSTIRMACNVGDMDILDFLHGDGCVPDDDLFYDSIREDDRDIVTFFLEKNMHPCRCPTSMEVAVKYYRGDIMDMLIDHGYEISNEVVDMATYDTGMVEWFMRVRDCHITPGAYITTIEHDMHEQNCLNVLNWLHDHWKFEIGFSSYEELLKDERWLSALAERDPEITLWFKDKLG